MRVVIGYSGGKDCSTSAILHLERGYDVTCACYVPYFNDEIPLVPKSRIEYLYNAKNHLESLGAKFIFIKGISYYDYCMGRLVKGDNKGLVRGFPCFLKNKCGFARDSKIKSCDTFFSLNAHKFDYMDVGYTADENRGVLTGYKKSLLTELGYTQKDTFSFVRNYHNGVLFSPAYITGARDGCSLCPQGKSVERYIYFNDYPSVIPIVEYMQEVIFKERGFYPLRYKRFFIENENFVGGYGSNVSLFGTYYN